jgi:hypothetical protein
MNRPDKPADPSVTRYEQWWTLAECVRLLHDATETLSIEALGSGRADLVVTVDARRELHRVRHNHPNGAWSLAALEAGADRLLQNVGDQLAGNDDRAVFVSPGDVPELRELCEAAQEAEDAGAFERDCLTTRSRREGFARLRRCWACEAPAALDRLQRIDVRTAGEQALERRVQWGLQALFVASPNRVRTELLDILADSSQRTLTRRQLVERLARRGSRPRRLDDPGCAADAVAAATDRYLDAARQRFIRGAVVPRQAAATLTARLDGAAGETVLTGPTGVGKTACVVEVIDALREQGVPVLAFRIDHVLSASTPADLGRRLELEESPVLVLAEAARAVGRPGVLVVDQLDAASETAGADADPCALVERLVHEMRGTAARATLHTVVACRAFDWRNDPRLRRLVPAPAARIEVVPFAGDEVRQILRDSGFDPESFPARQLEILRLPQHLSLFLEATAEESAAPTFATATALLDRYWTGKRRAVAKRAAPLPDEWMTAVRALCDEIGSTRQPTAARERLDDVSPAYLQHLEAEGVVTVHGRRYGFGHETLSDYFAARVWFNRRESLIASLTGSEQHLSRRARVRQALSYLRNADPTLYVRELGALLAHQDVRPHIKDLAFALLAEAPDPTEQEWTLWEQWLGAALQALEQESTNPDRLSAIAWRRFFESRSWFVFADRRGVIEGWLASDNDRVVSAALRYLGRHDVHAPDLVAALLEPYAGLGGRWTARLRLFMESAHHQASRRLFDLFLHLIDNSTLDEARRRDVANGTFWTMLAGLGENRPDWVPEVLASRLRRRLAVIHSAGEDAGSRELPGYDDDAVRLFRRSADHAPSAFVRHVLAPVLEISDATVTGTKPPRHDAVWPVVARTEYPEVDDACLAVLSAALAALAGDDDADLREVVADLRERDTHVANQLLLALYRGGAARHADEAVELLCDEPWRLQCGFSDSPQWHAAEAIRAVAPLCSAENRERLQRLLLEHVAPDERGLRGFRQAGRARFVLLSAIPPDLRSARANQEVQGLERRFGTPEGGSGEIAVDSAASPLDESAVDAMSDEQWLSAIAGHRPGAAMPTSSELKDGAWELANHLATRAAENPDRFARLALKLPADAHPVYLERTLTVLMATTVESDLKLLVCRKAFDESRGPCGQSIAQVLGRIVQPLPNDAVRMLHWLATEHEDPVARSWQAEDPGIDTARGSAADAVRRVVARDHGYLKRFRPTLDRLIHDPSPSVRACTAETLRAVSDRDPALGMELFLNMNLSDDALLAAPQVYRFIRDSLRDRFGDVRPVIERMLGSPEPEVCEAGARLASLAALEHAGGAHVPEGAAQPAVAAMSAQPQHRSAADLAADAMRGGPSHRMGVAHVAAANLAMPEYRSWSAATLAVLFDDDDIRVRRQAAACFRHVQDDPLDAHDSLLETFCTSKAFVDDPASILHPLEASRQRLPGAVCTVCEKFLDRFGDEARDPHGARHADALTVATLAFRTYHQHRNDAWTSRALDLIDRLCLEQIGGARDALEQFER